MQISIFGSHRLITTYAIIGLEVPNMARSHDEVQVAHAKKNWLSIYQLLIDSLRRHTFGSLIVVKATMDQVVQDFIAGQPLQKNKFEQLRAHLNEDFCRKTGVKADVIESFLRELQSATNTKYSLMHEAIDDRVLVTMRALETMQDTHQSAIDDHPTQQPEIEVETETINYDVLNQELRGELDKHIEECLHAVDHGKPEKLEPIATSVKSLCAKNPLYTPAIKKYLINQFQDIAQAKLEQADDSVEAMNYHQAAIKQKKAIGYSKFTLGLMDTVPIESLIDVARKYATWIDTLGVIALQGNETAVDKFYSALNEFNAFINQRFSKTNASELAPVLEIFMDSLLDFGRKSIEEDDDLTLQQLIFSTDLAEKAVDFVMYYSQNFGIEAKHNEGLIQHYKDCLNRLVQAYQEDTTLDELQRLRREKQCYAKMLHLHRSLHGFNVQDETVDELSENIKNVDQALASHAKSKVDKRHGSAITHSDTGDENTTGTKKKTKF